MPFLRDFKIGDVVSLYVDHSSPPRILFYSYESDKTYPATILHQNFEDIWVGWKDGEIIPDPPNGVNLIKNSVKFPGYIAYILASANRKVAGLFNGKSVNHSYPNGCNCQKCNLNNPYAIPNQKNGGYICFNCR